MRTNKIYIYINYNINYIYFNILKNNYYKYNNISHILLYIEFFNTNTNAIISC